MRAFLGAILTKGKVALEAGALAVAVLVVRLVIDGLSLEFVTPGPLLTSIVAGGLFVIGLIVAGTLADYKESERMPAEITAALDNIHEDARSIKHTWAEFDLAGLEAQLQSVVAAFRSDIADPGARTCLDAINELSGPIVELEGLDVPANYIVRLRTEQGNVRRNVLRFYHIQRTEFLPSAYILIWTIAAFVVAVLAFAKIEPGNEALLLVVPTCFFFIYLVRLLKVLDTPFRVSGQTKDDVSLFLLKEFSANLTDAAQAGAVGSRGR